GPAGVGATARRGHDVFRLAEPLQRIAQCRRPALTGHGARCPGLGNVLGYLLGKLLPPGTRKAPRRAPKPPQGCRHQLVVGHGAPLTSAPKSASALSRSRAHAPVKSASAASPAGVSR